MEIKTYKEYSDAALKFAVYNNPRMYPFKGLYGETGELVEKLKKLDRGDKPLDDNYKQLIISEISDVMWYINALLHDYGINLYDVVDNDIIPYIVDRSIDAKDVIDKTPLVLGIELGGIAMAVHTLERRSVSEKKRQELIAAIVGDVCEILYILEQLCSALNCTLCDAANVNIEKLTARANKGMIKGSGDEREKA